MIFRAAVFLFLVLLASPARAEDTPNYDDISLINFVHTLVRFNAIDLNDDVLIDEYASVTDCDLVESFYENDFRWSQVRQLIRESIKVNINTFPTAYHYNSKLQLSRYDFKNKNFRFTDDTALRAVNTFNFTFTSKGPQGSCNGHKPRYIPSTYNIVIGTPVSINGLPFGEDEAKALLQRLESAGNTDRIIYVRFDMTIVYVEPLHKTLSPGMNFYTQVGTPNGQPMRIDARLDNVTFYEDPERTKKLYSFTP